MKKRSLLLVSIMLVTLSIVTLVGVSFAWFVGNMKTSTGGFNVNVVSVANVDIKFYRKFMGSTDYTQVMPSSSFIGVDNEMAVPGEPIYCRIDIINNGTAGINVNVDFTGVTYIIGGETSGSTFIDALKKDFVILFAHQSNLSTQAPTEPPNSEFDQNEIKFLNQIVGESTDGGVNFPPIGNEIRLMNNITVPQGSTLSFYYRYLLKPDFSGFDGHTFNLSATGIRVVG